MILISPTEGIAQMTTQTIKCPNCGHLTTVTGNPGEKLILTCTRCNTEGVFRFPKGERPGIDTYHPSAIEVTGLTKFYGKFKAVDNVSFTVKRGEIFGFLGPNGAGKTTTIKALLDLLRVTAGEIAVNGYNMRKHGKEARKFIGYLPEQVAFYNNLTALQNLQFYAEMKGTSKEECPVLLDEFGLSDTTNKKVGAFSKGMIQRLGMARTVLGNPPILILDEPAEGLDARGVVLVREKIKELKKKGATIFISSHILSEIQAVCDRVGIIHKGVLVAQDTVATLSKKLNLKPMITVEVEHLNHEITDAVKQISGVDKVTVTGNTLQVICDAKTKANVIRTIATAGGNILNLQTQEPSLEEVFLRYTAG